MEIVDNNVIRKLDGTLLYMTPVIWRMFIYLYERMDKVVSSKDFYDNVFCDKRHISHLRTNIMQLRRGLDNTGLNLYTICGHGYMLSREEKIETLTSNGVRKHVSRKPTLLLEYKCS